MGQFSNEPWVEPSLVEQSLARLTQFTSIFSQLHETRHGLFVFMGQAGFLKLGAKQVEHVIG